MAHKTTRIIALVSFLIIMTATTPLGYAYNWPAETPDMRLTWDIESDWMPSIAQASDGKIWVVWHTYRTGNEEIFYKVYDASKVHPWSSDTKLTTDPNVDVAPSIMRAKDDKIWIVWSSNRTGNYDIFYKVYNGASWSPDHNLTTDPNRDELPSIMQASDGKIWIVWSTNREGNFDIYYKTSTDYGVTWSPDTQLHRNSTADDRDPSIMQASDGKIWVVWVRKNNIFYKIYNGTTWLPSDNAVTNDQPPNIDSYPSIMQALDGKIWVVWSTNKTGNFDIFYKLHDGFTWVQAETRLTNDIADDFMSSIMQASDKTIWIVWASLRANNCDIYYRTTAIPQPHNVAIFSVTTAKALAYRGQMVPIEVVAQNHGTNAETFEVRCYAGSTLIGSKTIGLAPGQLYPMTFIWNTTGVAASTYTIIAEASTVSGETAADNTFIDGTVQIKILGDINGDNRVNILDADLFTYDAWAEPGDPRWNNGRSDLNGDNIVDVFDAAIIAMNFEGP